MCLAPPSVALVIPADTRAITFARDDMSMTLGWYRDGGPVMLLILLVAIAGIVVLFERTYVIVMRSSNSGRAFIERIIQLVRVGKIDDAIKQCTASTAVLPDMGLLILRSRSRDETDLQNVADAAALAVLPKLTRRLHYLSTLAVTAGLLGLFGALFEIHDMLMTAGADSAAPGHMDRGLAAACSPPMFGVGVAIVLLLGRGYLVSQAEAITEQVREFSARLINALIDRPDVRLGHR